MARYSLQITIQATQIEDVEPDPDEGRHPLASGEPPMVKMMGQALDFLKPGRPMFPAEPTGVRITKGVNVSAESFAALCEILGRFESLAARVEVESEANT